MLVWPIGVSAVCSVLIRLARSHGEAAVLARLARLMCKEYKVACWELIKNTPPLPAVPPSW